jgi:hypothetical protein
LHIKEQEVAFARNLQKYRILLERRADLTTGAKREEGGDNEVVKVIRSKDEISRKGIQVCGEENSSQETEADVAQAQLEAAYAALVEGKRVLQKSEEVARALDAVCLIRVATGSCGTGFLIANGYIMTNHHVLKTVEAATTATVTFFFEGDDPGITLQLDPESFFQTSPKVLFTLPDSSHLDYTVVRLSFSCVCIKSNSQMVLICEYI